MSQPFLCGGHVHAIHDRIVRPPFAEKFMQQRLISKPQAGQDLAHATIVASCLGCYANAAALLEYVLTHFPYWLACQRAIPMHGDFDIGAVVVVEHRPAN